MSNKINVELDKIICNDYLQNKITQTDLAVKYNLSRLTIMHVLDRNNIKKMEHGEYERKLKLDETFFHKLTDNSAYWLGFIFGDGNIQAKNLRIMLAVTDLKHLENFKNDIKSEHKLSIGSKKSSYSVSGEVKFCKIAISSKILIKKLYEYGLCENKTLRQKFPFLEDKIMNAFLRGYMDADGCVYYNPKIRSQSHIIFTGNREFVESIGNFLINKNIISKFYINKDSGDSYSISIQRNKDKVNLYNYFYNNSSRHLERKFDKFKQIVSSLSDK